MGFYQLFVFKEGAHSSLIILLLLLVLSFIQYRLISSIIYSLISSGGLMSTKHSFKQRFQYFFDNLMSAGTPAMIGMLGLLSLAVVVIAGLIISVFQISQDGTPIDFAEASWEALMRTLDSGTMGGDVGLGFRLVMLMVTLGGIFIVSSLIGVLSSGMEAKLEELRKGRSLVLEQDHTVILGWSPQIFTVIPEIVISNENQKNPVIAVLADKDKVEMEDELKARIGSTKNTRVIVRSGNPFDPTELEIINPHEARSIIILRPETEDADSFVVKTMLAITNNPNRHPEPYNIVTSIDSEKNLSLLHMIGVNDNLRALLTSDLIARVTAQTSRQSGLSVVYTELLNFGGDEIYFKKEPSLSGRTYKDILMEYEDSTVMGLQTADGKVLINPAMSTRLQPGDSVIAISADDDTIRRSGLETFPVDLSVIQPQGKETKPKPEKALLLGWNAGGEIIVRELDDYVAKGSLVCIVADDTFEKSILAMPKLTNQKIVFKAGDTTDRDLLDNLKIMDYDHVIVLSDGRLDVQAADARTLITLLHLRDIAEKDSTPFSIVSEMLDLRNRELAEVAKVDDFIVSDHLISLMLAQLSENSNLYDVFTDLFDPDGAEIYLKPITDYVDVFSAVNFYTLVEAASQRGETAIGYRIVSSSKDSGLGYGVRTNPKKSAKINFHPDDKLIVLAN